MAAGKYDIVAEQGATLSRVFTWKDSSGTPIDLSGYSARMQVRQSHGADVVLDASSDIALGGAAGTITLEVSATDMAAVPGGVYAYDLELQSGAGFVTRLLQGSFRVSPNVTR